MNRCATKHTWGPGGYRRGSQKPLSLTPSAAIASMVGVFSALLWYPTPLYPRSSTSLAPGARADGGFMGGSAIFASRRCRGDSATDAATPGRTACLVPDRPTSATAYVTSSLECSGEVKVHPTRWGANGNSVIASVRSREPCNPVRAAMVVVALHWQHTSDHHTTAVHGIVQVYSRQPSCCAQHLTLSSFKLGEWRRWRWRWRLQLLLSLT